MEDSKVKVDDITSKVESPLVFISHDSRDADIAEAFSKLLKSVSAGMLKSFRSSDNKGTQGIEFGIEWYPKVIDSLHSSTDLVCILTELSINRPWILFEAGMAKGKLHTPILGLAVGIPLSVASTGPFALFQNCDDEVAALTKLVNQLVKKLPNSEPDEEVIKQQVEIFRMRAQEILKKRAETSTEKSKQDPIDSSDNAAKLFEEVKLMFKELPSRIENISQKPLRKFGKRMHPRMIEEIFYVSSRKVSPKIAVQMLLAPLRSDFPWVYDAGVDAAEKAIKSKGGDIDRQFGEFKKIVEITFEHPIMREFNQDELDYRYLRELPYIFEGLLKDWLMMTKEDKIIDNIFVDKEFAAKGGEMLR